MKKLLLIALVAAGCGEETEYLPDINQAFEARIDNNARIVTIRKCEYIMCSGYGQYANSVTYTHCGDCSNPIHHTDTLITTK